MSKTATRLFVMFFALSLSLTAVCQTSPGIDIVRNVAMKTRDGVTLYSDVYRPAGAGSSPVLLERTPYNKEYVDDRRFARMAVARGFMVVVQDVRGRYTSEGEWYPFKHEINDGYDSVEWAAALPHSNGKVGMFGGSYVGAMQMLAAISQPPHLAGICPVVTASNYHENWAYQGGAFEQWFNESWTSGLAQDTASRVIRQNTNALNNRTVLPLNRYPLFNVEPFSDPAHLTRSLAPYFLDWLDHPEYDDYWKKWAIDANYDKIQVPALTVAAWYDIFQGGSLRNFLGLKNHAGNQAARAGQHLLIAIGGHAGQGEEIGTVDFGPAAAQYSENAVTLDWYDYLLNGKKNEFATDKPVRIFVMGEDKWRDEDAWPLVRAIQTNYYLHSSGKANSVSGDGSISTDIHQSEAPDSFVNDPAHPVPTVGGPLCCRAELLPAGPRDQKAVESRADVLVYSTPPFEQDMEVTGPVMLDLYAKSSAIDTDFTAKLVDVWSSGYVQNLTEGILRARYRKSTSAATLLVPGKIYEFKIDLWSTSNVFLKGHRLRVEVSSSNFPRFDRNLNTGKSAAASSEMIKATNTVFHDKQHPSALVLPIVPRAAELSMNPKMRGTR